MTEETPIAFVRNRPLRIVGTQHTGWLPANAALPRAELPRDVVFDFEIQFDGAGYLLLVASQDGSLYGDTWHVSQEEAEGVAEEAYNISPDEWQRG